MTAELAVGLPVLVLLLAAALTAVSATTTKLRCVDAAREGARAAARGEPDAAGVARRSAPEGAAITVTSDGSTVRVTVRADVLPFARTLVGGQVSAEAVAEREPGFP